MRNVHLLCPLAFMFLVSRFTEVVTSGLVLKVNGYYVYFINLPTRRSSTNGWYSRDPQMHIVRTDAGLQEHLHPLHWLLHACISTMVRLRAPRACTTWRKKARVILFEHGFTRPWIHIIEQIVDKLTLNYSKRAVTTLAGCPTLKFLNFRMWLKIKNKTTIFS